MSPAREHRPPRRSQAERRSATRAKVLDAATRVFAERGYEGTTMADVAARAGISKGGLYWTFPSKQDLLFALLDERVEQRARDLFDAIKNAPLEANTAPWVDDSLSALIDQPGLILLFAELRVLAVRDPALRERFSAHQQKLRRDMGEAFEVRYSRLGLPPPFPAERLAAAVIALTEGLALTRLIDPAAPTEGLLGEILILLYNGIAARSR